MAEYIERSDALSEIDEWMESVGTALIGKGLSYYAELQGCIEDCKAADVAPVRHGRNINAEWPSLFECSVCGWSDDDTTTGDTAVYNYCPNCGTKMDLEG